MNNALITTNNSLSVQDITTVSKTFFESGMFSDCKSAAQAMVKIMAGAEVGLPAFQSMSGIHIIQGKPVIGAGLIAAKIKASGKYDYRVVEQTDTKCSIDFYQAKEKIGNSTFTKEDAVKAQTKNLDKFPKNMLFARAISNGVKWYCPDVFAGPVYVPEEMPTTPDTEDVPYTDVTPAIELKPMTIGGKAFKSALAAMKEGKSIDDVCKVANTNGLAVTEEIKNALIYAVEQAA